MAYLWVAVGSAFGGMARHAVGVWSLAWFGPGFPWGTLIVNVVGSFIIGAFAAAGASASAPYSENMRLFVAVGLCGGFTTFSAFSLQTLNLIQSGAWAAAALNAAGSVVLCVGAVAVGYAAFSSGT